MKTQTSTTFDHEHMFRVRLELNTISRQFFDAELIYKESATKEKITEISNQFMNRIDELLALGFEIQAKLTMVSLPHGHQEMISEVNDENEFSAIKNIFILASNQLIKR